MALDSAPLLTKKSVLAFALETTNGTAVAVDATNAVTPMFGVNVKYSTEAVEHEPEESLSNRAQGRGARPGSAEFEHKLFGGATDPDWCKLLRMCGLALNTRVYTPVSGATETGTIARYVNGRKKALAGCMGNFVITATRGQQGRIRYSMQGVQVPPSSTSLLAPTRVTTVAPRAAATFTIGGTTYRIPEVVFDQGNVVVLREDITGVDGSSNPTGYRCAYITGRKPMVKVAPEALPFSTKDWHDFYQSGTTAALALTLGTTNNGLTLAAPKMELQTDPDEAERNGTVCDALEFLCLGNTDAGDDEYSITML